MSLTSIFETNASTVGRTPLVRLNRVTPGGATVLAKMEARNPSCSVKDRIGLALVEDALARGVLRPGMKIVEPTSGNTGIALASVAAARGFELTLTMPETMSLERRRVLAMLGARLILSPGAEGMNGSVRMARELVESDPDLYFMPQQFENPANPAVHERTTGPEIWIDTAGAVDVLIAGVGTGGTISGTGRYLKARKDSVQTVAVEPTTSPVITQTLAGQPVVPGPHRIQGIGAGFIPGTLDLDVVDRVEQVSSEEAVDYARRLAREEGILAGISSGAAAAAAARVAADPAFDGKTVVVILPDAGERYLSSVLYDGIEG
ncbi:cysteine synthase A [Phaeovibrio sulfidiphilus]|uniref:Cysteine synthase n=1 Tax=Phaeovibrio sulfidiphilus TaxID=1220600 RepID=A0A8J6YLS9_9PROT|nr:cysteine synthase A [Phaeovibrio sulfidiphilus]MBE1236943.1 cysteine synthase A [Phaeovibrio sulfidiphilus]